MAAFLTERFTLAATITKMVDSAEFDRTVVVASRDVGSLYLAFDGSGDEVLWPGTAQFVLPQGQELWGRDTSGTGNVDLLVTR